MIRVESDSHFVYMGADVVVKIIDDASHSRLDREVALAPHLPTGLAPPLLASGRHFLNAQEVHYACYARVPGSTPGMGMTNVDAVTARRLTEDAVQRLDELHHWVPQGVADETLREPLNHGGFTGQEALAFSIESLASLDQRGLIASRLLNGLREIAQRAPLSARIDTVVHADCHWGNWLTCDRHVTALLDFEWARFGEPVDDWFF
jgi:aminoglycoside phosphotransferase (APT) family kinase protein